MAGQRPVPKDTARVLTTEAVATCHNLGLILERLIRWEQIGNRWDVAFHVKENRQGQWREAAESGGEAKGLWLSDRQEDHRTRLIDEPLLRRSHVDAALLSAHRKRWARLVGSYGADEKSKLRFELRTETRLVVGLGADSVLETALTLHRIYGFPVIPATALKGLTRTWVLLELALALGVPALDYRRFQERKGPNVKNKQATPLNRLEELLAAELDTKDQELQQTLQAKLGDLKKEASGAILQMDLDQFRSYPGLSDFRAVFGYPGRAGEVLFFDAIPRSDPPLVADVMNVHYPDYYRDDTSPPSDDQNPIPVSFLAVAEGATFCFAVAPRRDGHAESMAYAQKAREWLELALRKMGVGAKTMAGYGYFGEQPPVKFGQAAPEPSIPHESPDGSPQHSKEK